MAKKLSSPYERVDDLARHVENTLDRADPRLPRTLVSQAGKMLRFCLRQHLRGNYGHPGIAKMAKMGRCCHRQAQRNLRVMEAWGVLCPMDDIKGGRHACRYKVDLGELKRTLIRLGCNPTAALEVKMHAVSTAIAVTAGVTSGVTSGGDIDHGINHDTMSPDTYLKIEIRFCGSNANG